MLVEFVGCSGAGKTTLLLRTLTLLRAAGVNSTDSKSVVGAVNGAAWIKNDVVRNLFADLVLARTVELPADSAEFLKFGIDHIRATVPGRFDRFNRVRALRRQLAIGELCRRRSLEASVCLMDEGPLGSAHSVCVHPGRALSDDTLRQWFSLVPKPDLALHVALDAETAVERTLHRKDPPLRGRTPGAIEAFVRTGHEVFLRISRIADADWWVELDGTGNTATESGAERVVQMIREKSTQCSMAL